MDLPILDESCKWNHVLCGLCDLFLSLGKMFSRFTLFLLMIDSPFCLNTPQFVYPFTHWWKFGSLPLFAVINDAAMNICVQMSNSFYTRIHSPLAGKQEGNKAGERTSL